MALHGAAELRRRLVAIQKAANAGTLSRSGVARKWQTETVAAARRRIPVRTGKTRASIRPGRSRRGDPAVVGLYTINFIEKGTKAHDIPKTFKRKPRKRASVKLAGGGYATTTILKFQNGGQTFFRKRVHKPADPARPFKAAARREGLRKADFLGYIIETWNEAA